MGKPRSLRVVDSYTIRGTNKIVKAGDCVLMLPTPGVKPYVAIVDQIVADRENNLKVRVRWYYHPEETQTGRLKFHGDKEVFLSDHVDIQSAKCIFGKCTIYSLEDYTKLEVVGCDDYFCRFQYFPITETFEPDEVQVYCTCLMPYNPDEFMIQCDDCFDWFHLECIELDPQEAACQDKHFVCPQCATGREPEGAIEGPDPLVVDESVVDGSFANIKPSASSAHSTIEDAKRPIALERCEREAKRQKSK